MSFTWAGFQESAINKGGIVAWKSDYLWFIWLIWFLGSLVIGPSLAGSLVQAEAETIRIHPSFTTHDIQYSSVQTLLVTSVTPSPNSLATKFIVIQSWYYLIIVHLRDLHQLQHCELKQSKTNTPINNTTSQYLDRTY
jgi:hypothetical protein